MQKTFQYPQYDFNPPPELASGQTGRHPVVVVGAGPVGLCMAIDLARQGQPVLLLDEDNTVSTGSRAVCYAKRTLEVLDRMGFGDEFVSKGVSWDVGRTFLGEREVFNFNLRPQPGHRRPGMINLQQYHLEQVLVERALQTPGLELRFKNRVTAVSHGPDGARLSVQTPAGSYQLHTDWLLVADGARSPIRSMLGLDVQGHVFTDRFLIADVVMKADYPAERWFWFDPPFHPNQSVLLHKQADNVWRIDFQLGWQADPVQERQPEKVTARIRAMLGDERAFELEWVSIYTFQCRRMARFNHGRIIFLGDAAHQVSPFGARGANSGIQDADNLAWKLALVLRGQAPAALLDSYSAERCASADENISNSTRSTDFITPKSATSRRFRDTVLQMAAHYPFARALVNSGRLSVPSWLHHSPLNTPDTEAFDSPMSPCAPMSDAPIQTPDGQPGWLLAHTGNRFQLLHYSASIHTLPPDTLHTLRQLQQDYAQSQAPGQPPGAIAAQPLLIAQQGPAPEGVHTLIDSEGSVAQRYDLRTGSTYLLRPDQHVAARWRSLQTQAVQTALARASGHALNA